MSQSSILACRQNQDILNAAYGSGLWHDRHGSPAVKIHHLVKHQKIQLSLLHVANLGTKKHDGLLTPERMPDGTPCKQQRYLVLVAVLGGGNRVVLSVATSTMFAMTQLR